MSITPFPGQLPEENDRWYSRLCSYIALKGRRSVRKVYEDEWLKALEKKLRRRDKATEGKPARLPDSVPGAWSRAMLAYHWMERTAAWDTAETERKQIELATAQDEQRQHELDAARLMRDKGKAMIGLPHVRSHIEQDDKHITIEAADPSVPRTAAVLFKESREQARGALEMPQGKSEAYNYNIDLSKLSIEQLEMLADGTDIRAVLAFKSESATVTESAPIA